MSSSFPALQLNSEGETWILPPVVTTTKKRRFEITFFEQERIVQRLTTAHCHICRLNSEMLTPEQAGDLAQVQVQDIHRWLAQGKAHGMKMLDGYERVCKNSLFLKPTPQPQNLLPE